MEDNGQSMENMQAFMHQQQQVPENPLKSHFRVPVIHMRLPSDGKFWPEGSLEFPESRELPVYPMTGKDEILIKTPDALMNGSATAEVIMNCIPAIKDAYAMPTIDLDAALIAIRMASYGEMMDITSICPKCGEENEFEIDLRIVLDLIEAPEYGNPITIDNLAIYLKPNSYHEYNSHNITTFEQQRIVAIANDTSLTQEQKMQMFSEIFYKLTNLSETLIIDAIAGIVMADGTQVTEKPFLKEFIEKTTSDVFQAIDNRIKENYEVAATKPFNAECQNQDCKLQYTIPIIQDYSHFFD